MTWVWVLGVILALLLLLLLTRVGAHAEMNNGTLTIDVRFGVFRIRVFPVKQKKASSKNEKPKQQKVSETEKKKSKIAFADLKDAIQTLWPPLKKALNRTRKGIRIHPLTLHLTLGAAHDPASGAEQYGYLHAGVWTAMPILEKLLVIPDPSIHIGIDFDSPDTKLEGKAGLSARIGTLLGVVLTVAIPALRWFLSWRKKMKQISVPQSVAEKQTAV